MPKFYPDRCYGVKGLPKKILSICDQKAQTSKFSLAEISVCLWMYILNIFHSNDLTHVASQKKYYDLTQRLNQFISVLELPGPTFRKTFLSIKFTKKYTRKPHYNYLMTCVLPFQT